MKLINSPIERITAITDVILAVVAFGGIIFYAFRQAIGTAGGKLQSGLAPLDLSDCPLVNIHGTS